MILKIQDFRPAKEHSGEVEEWNYFDNIVSASNYYDEETKSTVVRCRFRDDSVVIFDIPHVAYLMSDAGKTIDRIYKAPDRDTDEVDKGYDRLQDAAAAAMRD